MSHASPAAYLVWTLITGILGVFLLFHLWSFDRFKCLKWNSGAYSGAFKRIMTYSYLITVPLIFAYASGNVIIKYHEGFIQLDGHGIIPKPYQLWEPWAQDTIFPLMLCFSVGWSLEMVTHLEELCFWLFLVNSGSSQQNWFQSMYFKTWIVGSTVAVIYMPLVTILTRNDHLRSEAFTFLAGSLGSLSLTVWFLPVLWTFPKFLHNLRMEGVDVATIVRLTKFSELNTIRVVMRFMFTVPLLILGVDGVRPHTHINESMLWVDFCTMIAGFGCAISSGITLVIFFPRSIEGEIAAKDAAKERKRSRSFAHSQSLGDVESAHHEQFNYPPPTPTANVAQHGDTYPLTEAQMQSDDYKVTPIVPYQQQASARREWSMDHDEDEERDIPTSLPQTGRPFRANQRQETDSDKKNASSSTLTESNLSAHNVRMRGASINPMISNFTSPIDLYSGPGVQNESRLTFNRR
ncbi:hypothetical protein CVT24_012575 [Panaeolus cyanescens]|uniref:Uncharacterized protein n=1 Tax=Panaeolus cyanescens TaxID=181874 RepID=A0A409YK01_9AGAR|nr:hypothetical protein CVT24_012575 [Panaeolus cyanescens]